VLFLVDIAGDIGLLVAFALSLTPTANIGRKKVMLSHTSVIKSAIGEDIYIDDRMKRKKISDIQHMYVVASSI
jgi:hypothetical protein